YIHDIHGVYTGSGYGLHNQCAQNVVFRGNVIERAHRHSIYQAMTLAGNSKPIQIMGNTIIDHAGEGEAYPGGSAASIVAARSDNVTVMGNVLIGGHIGPGISVEYDPNTHLDCTRCMLIGNRFLNSGDHSDIWVNATSPVRLWGNTRQL